MLINIQSCVTKNEQMYIVRKWIKGNEMLVSSFFKNDGYIR